MYANYISDHQIRTELIQSIYDHTKRPLIQEYNSSSKPLGQV